MYNYENKLSMKHYRILEKKGDKKEYKIQYIKSILFGFHFWKNINHDIYHKYDDALREIKKIIKQNDYETDKFIYHYIDAYKIFKSQTLNK
jgi:tRNA A22 N-methylase